jgi:hypothetical protein
MKKYILYCILLSATCFFHKQATAQGRRAPSINFGVQVVQPLGQFGDVYDGYPAGFAGTFSAPLGNSPFEVGVGLAWNNMGSQNEDVNAYVGTDEFGDSIYDQGTMRIRSNNNRFQILGRFRPLNGFIQPYADGIFGVETYKTKTDITLNGNGYTEADNSQRQHLDISYSYGYAIGLRFRVAPSIFIDARFENLIGGFSTYVDQESIEVVDENSIRFETLESRTDKFTYQLGVAIGF